VANTEISVLETNLLILFGELMVVYCEDRTRDVILTVAAVR
jgi:hypothetical protein